MKKLAFFFIGFLFSYTYYFKNKIKYLSNVNIQKFYEIKTKYFILIKYLKKKTIKK